MNTKDIQLKEDLKQNLAKYYNGMRAKRDRLLNKNKELLNYGKKAKQRENCIRINELSLQMERFNTAMKLKLEEKERKIK